jgi:hypothetical protein
MARTASRSARTGRFVPARAARRSRSTTTTERMGRGTSNSRVVYRSASTGRFVRQATAERHPDTTIRQSV